MNNRNNAVDLFRDLSTEQYYEDHHRPVIIADNLRTPENMGSVLRLAGNIGALRTLFLFDSPPDFKTYKIKRTASGAYEKTEWQIIPTPDLPFHLPEDYQLIALETTPEATSIFQTPLPQRMAIVVGNEMFGIREEVLSQCRNQVFIPLPGPVYSLNVTHALSVALFEWYRQHSPKGMK